jgi:Leucine-rich repeat (LRR) protein
MAYIFISYALKDSRVFQISKLAKLLLKYPEIDDVLYCEESARDDFIKYMNEYLDKCDIVLLFCSPNSLNSEFVAMEWRAAIGLKKSIIPIYLDPKYIPPLLASKLGVEYNQNDLNLTIDNIVLTIKKNTSRDSSSTQLEEKIPFRGKMVRSSEFETLKELQKEIDNLVEKFEVNTDGFVISLDFSSVHLDKVPKTIRFFNRLMEVNFSEYSFKSDDALMNLKFEGLIIKIEDRPYQEGQIKVRIEREDSASKIGEENAKVISYAKGAYCSGEWDEAIRLFRKSTEISSLQGWISGVDFAKRMILKAEEEKIKEAEDIKKRIKAKEEIIKQLPDNETKVILKIEKILKKPFELVENLKGNIKMGVMVKDNHVYGLSFYKSKNIDFLDTLFELRNLKCLNLSRIYNLSKLPENFGDFRSLEELYLQSSKIHEFPESFHELSSLRILELNKNSIERLPAFIGKLNSLEYLNLKGNFLSEIPDTIGNLKSLHTCYLNFNKLERIPNSFGKLSSLKNLYLNFNSLFTIPDTICELDSLEYLNLSYNFLTALPEKLADIYSLKKLVIYGNNFKEVPRQIYYLLDRGVDVLK